MTDEEKIAELERQVKMLTIQLEAVLSVFPDAVKENLDRALKVERDFVTMSSAFVNVSKRLDIATSALMKIGIKHADPRSVAVEAMEKMLEILRQDAG